MASGDDEMDRLMAMQRAPTGEFDGGAPAMANPFLAGLAGAAASRNPFDGPLDISAAARGNLAQAVPPSHPPPTVPPEAGDPAGGAPDGGGFFAPGGLHLNLPGGLLLPGLGNAAQFQIGRGLHENGSELLTFRLVLDGADPENLPPQPVLQAMMNLLANQVMSQVARAGRPPQRRTSQSVIDGLQSTSQGASAELADTSCAVCQELLSSRAAEEGAGEAGNAVVRLPCEHAFHRCCIEPWLQEHNTCPTCRFELDTDDTEYNDRLRADRAETDQALEQKLVDDGASALSTAELKALLRIRKIDRNSMEEKDELIQLLQGRPAPAPSKKRKRSRRKPVPQDWATRHTRSRSAAAVESAAAVADATPAVPAAAAAHHDHDSPSDQENAPNPLDTSLVFEDMDEPDGAAGTSSSGGSGTRRVTRSSLNSSGRGRTLRGASGGGGAGEGGGSSALRMSPRANAQPDPFAGAAAAGRPKRARRASAGRREMGL